MKHCGVWCLEKYSKLYNTVDIYLILLVFWQNILNISAKALIVKQMLCDSQYYMNIFATILLECTPVIIIR